MNLKRIEKKWQKKWTKARIFEADPEKGKKKYFITVPYPYASGPYHIGHGRSYSCGEVFARYKRMQGYNVLFPMAFHITGTPVLAICNRIKSGDIKFTNMIRNYIKLHTKDDKKVERILKSFDKPWKVYNYFSKTMKQDFKTIGMSIDWRRVFTTGDKIYNKFIEWQYSKFKKKGYLKKMKHPINFCLTDQNAVGEDDIKGGDEEKVEVQEFTGIKFKLKKGEYILTATLRPETIFGLTNLWINPETMYIKARKNDEIWIISEEAFEKMNYQGQELIKTSMIKGEELIGLKAKAPIINKELLILPAKNIDNDIGTGPVMSVPSHAPPDYVMLKELQGNDKKIKKYGLKPSEVKNIKLVSMIKLKGYGNHPAKDIVESCRLKNVEKLKKELYRDEHHLGILKKNTGKYSGMPVEKAKEAVKNDLVKKGLAVKFYETSRKAECRCGGKVIVAVLDNQWFLDYNAKGWKRKAFECLNKITIYPDKYRNDFKAAFNWLDKRPCIRKKGLGTGFPYQKGWIIESLSDSTIYMSFYTIVHHLTGNNVKPEQLIPEFFDYVLLGKGILKNISEKTRISESLLKMMHDEFNYWYPMDHRHTAIMHISNHLSFMIFHHSVIFPKKHWPKTLTLIEPVNVEGQKMGKSKGNIIPLSEIGERFGADLFRLYMINNAEFSSVVDWRKAEFNAVKKHFEKFINISEKVIKSKKAVKNSLFKTALIKAFNNLVFNATKQINGFNLRKYVQISFYEIMNLFTDYLNLTGDYSGVKGLITDWFKILTPVIPHVCEELWAKSGNKGFISLASWPKVKRTAGKKVMIFNLINAVMSDVNEIIKLIGKKPKVISIYTCEDWKHELFNIIRKSMDKRDFNLIIKKSMKHDKIKINANQAAKIIKAVVRNQSKLLDSDKNEFNALKELKDFLEKEFKCKVNVIKAENSKEQKARSALPGKPGILIE